MCTVFNDLTKAFDMVSRSGLWPLLRKFGCTEKFTKILKSLHEGMLGRVNYSSSRVNIIQVESILEGSFRTFPCDKQSLAGMHCRPHTIQFILHSHSQWSNKEPPLWCLYSFVHFRQVVQSEQVASIYKVFEQVLHEFLQGLPKKNYPLRFFFNISATNRNFKSRFYRPIGNSFLRIIAKFHQKMSNRSKVISLLVRPPH